MLNLILRACILQAVHAGSLYVYLCGQCSTSLGAYFMLLTDQYQNSDMRYMLLNLVLQFLF